jgi:hypothetical protein
LILFNTLIKFLTGEIYEIIAKRQGSDGMVRKIVQENVVFHLRCTSENRTEQQYPEKRKNG